MIISICETVKIQFMVIHIEKVNRPTFLMHQILISMTNLLFRTQVHLQVHLTTTKGSLFNKNQNQIVTSLSKIKYY